MKILRWLLWPISMLYGFSTGIRNLLYNTKILSSEKFEIPVISIGNISTGGTGKSPLVNLLVDLLEPEFKVSVLSRGYGRQSSGFLMVDESLGYLQTGDEPKMIKKNHPSAMVAVCEKRADGIHNILSQFRNVNVVILDDAFQHRAVHPSLNILLFEYSSLSRSDWPLPTGNLREWRSGSVRADIIVITKCPEHLSTYEKKRCGFELAVLPHQKLYFTSIQYKSLVPAGQTGIKSMLDLDFFIERSFSFLVLTGIANPVPLFDFLDKKKARYSKITFKDHHPYSVADIEKIRSALDGIDVENKIILTTEKDYIRLEDSSLKESIASLPIFYLPIETVFQGDEIQFKQSILNHVRTNSKKKPND